MSLKRPSAFTIPKGSSLLHIPPPRSCQRALVTGGLHQVINPTKHRANHKHQRGTYTREDGSFAPAAGMPWLIGRYKVVELIGKGQSSVVLKAQDMFQPVTFVALKVLHSHYNLLGTQETDFIRRLNQADPDHNSATLRLITTFQFDSHYCLVFELLHPAPLVDVVGSGGRRSLSIIRQLTRQLLKALGFLRQQNVIHADLKPANLLLADATDFNTIKMVDFGNAIHCVHDELSLYYDDFELQTLLYRAPEVIFGVPFGLEVDMWSFGCILAELYMQDRLFTGKNKTAVIQQMVNLLGPLPSDIFQRGKFYSLLNKYCQNKPQKDGTQALMDRMGCHNYAFASFVASCLRFNPNERLSITKAAFHPFLAAELGLSYLLHEERDLCEKYESSLPPRYTHTPMVQHKPQRGSPVDLLREGTGDLLASLQPQSLIAPESCPSVPRARVVRQIAHVSPLKQEETSRQSGQEATTYNERRDQVVVARQPCNNDRLIEHGNIQPGERNFLPSVEAYGRNSPRHAAYRLSRLDDQQNRQTDGTDVVGRQAADKKIPCRRSLHAEFTMQADTAPRNVSGQAIDLSARNTHLQTENSLGRQNQDVVELIRPKPSVEAFPQEKQDGGGNASAVQRVKNTSSVTRTLLALRSTVQAMSTEQDKMTADHDDVGGSSDEEEEAQAYWDSGAWDVVAHRKTEVAVSGRKASIESMVISPEDMGHKIRRKLSSLSKSSFSSTHSGLSDAESDGEERVAPPGGKGKTESEYSQRRHVIENTPWIQERISQSVHRNHSAESVTHSGRPYERNEGKVYGRGDDIKDGKSSSAFLHGPTQTDLTCKQEKDESQQDDIQNTTFTVSTTTSPREERVYDTSQQGAQYDSVRRESSSHELSRCREPRENEQDMTCGSSIQMNNSLPRKSDTESDTGTQIARSSSLQREKNKSVQTNSKHQTHSKCVDNDLKIIADNAEYSYIKSGVLTGDCSTPEKSRTVHKDIEKAMSWKKGKKAGVENGSGFNRSLSPEEEINPIRETECDAKPNGRIHSRVFETARETSPSVKKCILELSKQQNEEDTGSEESRSSTGRAERKSKRAIGKRSLHDVQKAAEMSSFIVESPSRSKDQNICLGSKKSMNDSKSGERPSKRRKTKLEEQESLSSGAESDSSVCSGFLHLKPYRKQPPTQVINKDEPKVIADSKLVDSKPIGNQQKQSSVYDFVPSPVASHEKKSDSRRVKTSRRKIGRSQTNEHMLSVPQCQNTDPSPQSSPCSEISRGSSGSVPTPQSAPTKLRARRHSKKLTEKTQETTTTSELRTSTPLRISPNQKVLNCRKQDGGDDRFDSEPEAWSCETLKRGTRTSPRGHRKKTSKTSPPPKKSQNRRSFQKKTKTSPKNLTVKPRKRKASARSSSSASGGKRPHNTSASVVMHRESLDKYDNQILDAMEASSEGASSTQDEVLLL